MPAWWRKVIISYEKVIGKRIIGNYKLVKKRSEWGNKITLRRDSCIKWIIEKWVKKERRINWKKKIRFWYKNNIVYNKKW